MSLMLINEEEPTKEPAKISNGEIEAGRQVILRFFESDSLKPEYDGMTAWGISKLILEAAQKERLSAVDRESDSDEPEIVEDKIEQSNDDMDDDMDDDSDQVEES